MPAQNSFDYTIIRVVPHVERQEFINAGIILFCKSLNFLEARIDFELKRLQALAPDANLKMIREHLNTIVRVCAGGEKAGYFGEMSQAERFHWLSAPGSTVIQTSPVHCGLCIDPREALERLYKLLVVG